VRVAFAVLAFLVLGASAGATAQTTRVKVYRPLDGGDLIPTLHVTSKPKGACFSGSAADPRTDAWRCSIGNKLVDPCFSHPKAHTWVACPSDGTPFGLSVIRLHLLKPLPTKLRNHGKAGEGNPWAIKLAGGRICTFLTGATFSFHGKRANYGCGKTTFLAGSPSRSSPTWTITLGTARTAPPKTAVILVAAW
jgi:eukaryotic-like serine/threonine-protein kinase